MSREGCSRLLCTWQAHPSRSPLRRKSVGCSAIRDELPMIDKRGRCRIRDRYVFVAHRRRRNHAAVRACRRRAVHEDGPPDRGHHADEHSDTREDLPAGDGQRLQGVRNSLISRGASLCQAQAVTKVAESDPRLLGAPATSSRGTLGRAHVRFASEGISGRSLASARYRRVRRRSGTFAKARHTAHS